MSTVTRAIHLARARGLSLCVVTELVRILRDKWAIAHGELDASNWQSRNDV